VRGLDSKVLAVKGPLRRAQTARPGPQVHAAVVNQKHGESRSGFRLARQVGFELITSRLPYPGEHAAILAPGTWDRAQSLMTQRPALASGKSRNKHLALLSGLLFCESCATRMVYSYSGKGDRKYPYYLCLNAQRKGWAVCPAKSLPARAIEQSVLGRIREGPPGIFEPAVWEQMDRALRVQAIQAIVERVGYDETAQKISIRFHAAAGPEVRA
jgi:hypothetical protein